MRCLIVADLHYSLPQFDWLLSAAPQFDLVIFAGDALDVGSSVDFRAQIVVVKKYLALLSGLTRVILCSGNHDLDERNPQGEKIARWIGDVRELGIACDGDSLTIGDTFFTVCPWWDGPLVKQRIEDQLREAATGRLKRWIWVHQAPFIADGSWFDQLGSTWVFNAGLQPGRPPVHIVVDIDDGTAFWLPLGYEQYIDLNAPLQRPAEAITNPPEWLISLGRIADPSPAISLSAA